MFSRRGGLSGVERKDLWLYGGLCASEAFGDLPDELATSLPQPSCRTIQVQDGTDVQGAEESWQTFQDDVSGRCQKALQSLTASDACTYKRLLQVILSRTVSSL